MIDANMDTLKTIHVPAKIEAYGLIQEELDHVERRLLAEQPGQHSLLTDSAEQLFRAGGKRIRAAICLLSAGVFGAERESSISLAAGVEMLHTATLIHDDLLDGSAMRRGKPTINAGQNAPFSVLIGDYFFARAANLVAEANNVDIMDQFARTLMTILNGEITQRFSLWQVDRQEYFERIYAKTGDMFVLAARAPATLGGASQENLKAMERFGYHIGTAFQIIDDVLDFSSQQTQLGKPVGSDLRQGLFTLPAILYASRNPHDPDLQLLLDVQHGDHPAAPDLIASIRKSGVLDEAKGKAKDLVALGKQALEALPYSDYVEALFSVADAIVERQV